MKKKILFSLENFNNPYIAEFIKKIEKKYDVHIISSKKNNNLLYKNTKVLNYNYTFTDKIIDKICILFSNVHKSKKQKIYFQFQIEQEKNIFLKLLLNLKLVLSHFKFLPDMDILYKQLYKFYSVEKKFFDRYELFIYDFRLFEEHNNCKRYIYSAINHKNTKTVSWVYSWDNIFTFSTIKSSDFFIVWCDYIKKITQKIHKISHHKIYLNYPMQFEYLRDKPRNYKNDYLLFACSYNGNENNLKDYVVDDLNMIKLIIKIIKKNNLNIKVLVRPYPYVKYKKLIALIKKNQKIIKFDFNSYNFYKKNSSLKIHLKQKKKQILNSIAVLSFGSTFNIESSILNKPTFHLDFSDVKRKNDLYQYSNFSKNLDEFEYLKSYKCKNIIKNSKQLKNILIDLSKNKTKSYLGYGSYLSKKFSKINNKQIFLK